MSSDPSGCSWCRERLNWDVHGFCNSTHILHDTDRLWFWQFPHLLCSPHLRKEICPQFLAVRFQWLYQLLFLVPVHQKLVLSVPERCLTGSSESRYALPHLS